MPRTHTEDITAQTASYQHLKGMLPIIANIDTLIEQRLEAKKSKNFAEADRIRKELADAGIILEDTPQGTTWRRA